MRKNPQLYKNIKADKLKKGWVKGSNISNLYKLKGGFK